jgi:L-iditol 2-dehydrogenase
MSETMKAAVLHGVNDLRVEDVSRPELAGPDYCLVKIGACGICGSDVHFFRHMRIGEFVVDRPISLGHESAGVVVEVGPAVTNLKPGDRVAIEPGVPCRKCEFCRTGRYNLCAEVVFLACPPYDGAFAEYLAWPADYLFKLPDNVSLEEGAMVEPFAVGLHAARRAGVRGGDWVLVTGSGPIGLCALQAARANGATRVIVTDMVASRLEHAAKLGASDTVNQSTDNLREAVAEITGGRGVDIVLECSGTVPAVTDAVEVVKRGGTVQLVGNIMATKPEIPIQRMVERELTVSGLFRYVNCYPPSIEMISTGAVDVKSLITHHFPLAEAPQAMAWVDENKDKVIKGVIAP